MTIQIEFLEDEHGRKQVLDVVADIAKKALTDKEYKEFSGRITVLFQILKDRGVQYEEKGIGEVEGKTVYLLEMVKQLDRHPPLCESRVNWPRLEYGAFRAIFFYEEDEQGNQKIFFTQAVVKNKTYTEEFEEAIRISEKMMKDHYSKGGE